MERSVYLLEPQALFIPELSRIVGCAGGHVTRCAETLDVAELASLRADYAILDLDYTMLGVMNGLAFFRGLARDVQPLLLTEESDFELLARYRDAGAAAILPKAMSAGEVATALRAVFEAGSRRELLYAM